MPLSLRIISSPDGEPVLEWSKNFPEEGGSIGRAFGATMQLSDASREISGSHALINRGSRGYQIMDVSTNGLFINGNPKPLGKNNQSALNDGDVLDLGKYRLMVSCFVPEQATAQASSAVPSPLAGWEDDPFGGDLPSITNHLELETEVLPVENVMSFSAVPDAVIDDPFGRLEPEVDPEVVPARSTWLHDDSFDDDPFADDRTDQLAVSSRSPVAPRGHQPVPNAMPAFDPQQLVTMQAKQQELMTQAAEMALERLLTEMAPPKLEQMFSDFAPVRLFGRKPDYWQMYQRYFQRQQESQEWQLKFKAYFAECLRIKQSLGEK
ncbi:FHA domain-containing protein [uncultured Photobacterium sp.]|uniref:type VI secretion system-associated FHA domain protein n=1 Tax=uncultured Photobacterium sp. TaxID=173973 RepID=UPI00262BBB32|nr:FHA domain-containing protein [uncultured Photobacterium sp.]